MTNKKIYSLCEAVADIAFIAAKENYKTEDSREMISQFIKWGVNSPLDYIDSIYHFTIFKINQYHIR